MSSGGCSSLKLPDLRLLEVDLADGHAHALLTVAVTVRVLVHVIKVVQIVLDCVDGYGRGAS